LRPFEYLAVQRIGQLEGEGSQGIANVVFKLRLCRPFNEHRKQQRQENDQPAKGKPHSCPQAAP
jgi:hypothetical protein